MKPTPYSLSITKNSTRQSEWCSLPRPRNAAERPTSSLLVWNRSFIGGRSMSSANRILLYVGARYAWSDPLLDEKHPKALYPWSCPFTYKTMVNISSYTTRDLLLTVLALVCPAKEPLNGKLHIHSFSFIISRWLSICGSSKRFHMPGQMKACAIRVLQ